jgi:hypothetical protein
MRKRVILFSIAVIAVVSLLSGISFGKPCADDGHGLRGKCRKTVVNGVSYYDCVSAIAGEVTDCTYYVQ